MEETDFVNLVDLMRTRNVILAYSGEINREVCDNILRLIKNENTFPDLLLKNRVYRIIVECLENITRYGNLPETKDKPSLFLLLKEGNSYHIITGNFVYEKQADFLKKTLEEINHSSREQLKERYRESLAKDEPIVDPKGAGIGIYDIALKSGNPLKYKFLRIQNEVLFYILNTVVS